MEIVDYAELKRCRICGGEELSIVLDLGIQALTGHFPRYRGEAIPFAPLRLSKCSTSNGCGLVQLADVFDIKPLYGDRYGYRSGLNSSMVAHLRSKVGSILKSGWCNGAKVVLDIGSNDGTTLGAYPDGRYDLIGFDPLADRFGEYYPKQAKRIAGFFDADRYLAVSGGRKADIVTSISMFYDLPDPQGFVNDVKRVLSPEGAWVSEQSYLPLMLDRNSFDTVCHEHLEYYCLDQILWLADRAGLDVVDGELNDINGGSISFTAVHKSRGLQRTPRFRQLLEAEIDSGVRGARALTDFARRVAVLKEELVAFLKKNKAEGKRIVALGASTKGNVLLQYCGVGPDLISCIGEVNEEKYGCFTPGTEIPISPQAEVLASDPDLLLILPWHFRDFFLSNEAFKGRKLVFPLPSLEVVVPGQC